MFKYTDKDLTSRFILGKSVFMYATKQDIEDLKCYYQEFTTVPKLGFSEIKTKQTLFFGKDVLNWSKVTVNTFIMLQKFYSWNKC